MNLTPTKTEQYLNADVILTDLMLVLVLQA